MATGRFRVQFGRNTRRRFSVYREAERFLDGLRWEVDQGTYDPRDYRVDYPLGFKTLAQKWLKVKEKEVKRRSYNNLKNYISRAISSEAAGVEPEAGTTTIGVYANLPNVHRITDILIFGTHGFFELLKGLTDTEWSSDIIDDESG